MKKLFLSSIIFLFVTCCVMAQSVGIGNLLPDSSAALDVTASNKGLLIPRMSTFAVNNIVNPAKGLLVYDSLANQLMVNLGSPAAPNWQPVGNNNPANAWFVTGNGNIGPANFLGTINKQSLRLRVNNLPAGELDALGNISFGFQAGAAHTTGFSNVAIGAGALRFSSEETNLVAIGDSSLFNNGRNNPVPEALGLSNTAIGSKTLFSNTIGNDNTAIGSSSLFSNILGSDNTAVGAFTLVSNTNGGLNTAVGARALRSNTTGNDNTAVGWEALHANTTGVFNTTVGSFSLDSNTTGNNNSALGFAALNFNTSGSENTAVGIRSSFSNTEGENNTALGSSSFFFNTTGRNNTAVGFNALFQTKEADDNTVMGSAAASLHDLGSGNTIIGSNADADLGGIFNSVAVGQQARVTGNNQVRLGNSLTTSIGGIVGFTNISDGRIKRNVNESVPGIDFIMKLRPVTYQLDIDAINHKLKIDGSRGQFAKAASDNSKIIYSGFIAQEVEQAALSVGYDFSGIDKPKNDADLYGLRYSDFVVPMVKAVQQQQRMINDLMQQNAELEKRLQTLEKK